MDALLSARFAYRCLNSACTRAAIWIVLSTLAVLGCRSEAQVAGEWRGTVLVNSAGVEWRLALHLSEGKDGRLTGTIRIVDSDGAPDISVTDISLEGPIFRMAIEDMHATYEGTVKNGREIDGTFSWLGQRRRLEFNRASPQTPYKPAPPSNIDGTWLGAFDAEGVQVHFAVKIANTSGGLTAEWQSPDQSSTWVIATGVKRNGATLTIEVKAIGAVFTGRISDHLNSISGTFTQAGVPLPLVLKRAPASERE